MKDKFLLNGNWLIDWPGRVDAGGATFTYTRAEDDSETLITKGPIKQNLTLMVRINYKSTFITATYFT